MIYDSMMARAIDRVISEARLAYDFAPGSYTYQALNAAYALAKVYEAKVAEAGEATRAGDREITDARAIGDLFDAALQRDDLERGSVKFIKNVHGFWKKFGYVSARQFEAVRRTAFGPQEEGAPRAGGEVKMPVAPRQPTRRT